MADIASRSRYATVGVLCDIHHIARSVLHQIGEDHCIAGFAKEASTSHGPSIRPPMSSNPARMQPIRGRGRGRVDRRGRGRDGGPCHGSDNDSGLGTLEPNLPTSIPSHTYLSPDMFIPHTLTHHLPYPHALTHYLPYPSTLTHHLPYPEVVVEVEMVGHVTVQIMIAV